MRMSEFLKSSDPSISPAEKLSEREKQKRIHTWLGEQTTDYLRPQVRKKCFGEQLNNVNNDVANSALETNGSHGDMCEQLLKSQSLFVSNTKSNKQAVKSCLSTKQVFGNKGKGLSVPRIQFQSNVYPFIDQRYHTAATKIQALWRGYSARTKNHHVVGIRQEIRQRRAEQYIATLCNEVSNLQQKYKSEKKLRELQTEAIRFLWSQIRQMQSKFDLKVAELEEKIAVSKSSEDMISQSTCSKENLSLVEAEEKEKLNDAVEKLQGQVIQLQDALLSFSDRLIAENEDISAHSVQGDDNLNAGDDLHNGTDIENLDVVNETLQTFNQCTNEDGEVLSARDSVPKISVQNILEGLDSSLTEKELWSFCEQTVLAIKALKSVNIRYISPLTVFIRKDGLVSFSDCNAADYATYSAPELSKKDSKPSNKSLIFSLAVILWSAADFNMTEDQAPCLSSTFENMLIAMYQDEPSERSDVDTVLKICSEHHSSINSNSLQTCASLYAETCDMKKGKKRQIKSISFTELFAKEIEKTRSEFQSVVVPDLNTISFKLKPASDRQLSPKPKSDKTPFEKLMEDIKKGVSLQKQKEPKLYTVENLFHDNPELIQKLNILPGQRRKNMMAVKSALKKLSATDGKQVLPSAPQGLKAEIKTHDLTPCPSDNRSLILRWQPSYIYDKHGNKVKSGCIIGYRIYVNRQPKGMVNGIKCRALLDGLKQAGEYRIHVCAVSALGESDPSNTVIANLMDGHMSSNATSPQLSAYSPVLRNRKQETTHTKPEMAATFSIKKIEVPLAQSDDVVERVLQRYGIKKSSTNPSPAGTQHSYASSQTFLKSNKTPPNGSNYSFTQQPSSFVDDCAASTSSSDDHITPRTKALLVQLKDELLG